MFEKSNFCRLIPSLFFPAIVTCGFVLCSCDKPEPTEYTGQGAITSHRSESHAIKLDKPTVKNLFNNAEPYLDDGGHLRVPTACSYQGTIKFSDGTILDSPVVNTTLLPKQLWLGSQRAYVSIGEALSGSDCTNSDWWTYYTFIVEKNSWNLFSIWRCFCDVTDVGGGPDHWQFQTRVGIAANFTNSWWLTSANSEIYDCSNYPTVLLSPSAYRSTNFPYANYASGTVSVTGNWYNDFDFDCTTCSDLNGVLSGQIGAGDGPDDIICDWLNLNCTNIQGN